MSWMIALYFVLFGVLCIAGLWDDYRDRRPVWFLGCALLSNLVVGFLVVAYWQPSLLAPVGVVAPAAFIAAAGWEAFQAVEDIRALRADPELSETQQRVVPILTALVLPALCVPAFIVAGIAAFRA